MCYWLFTRIFGDMIHTWRLRTTPHLLEIPPKLIPLPCQYGGSCSLVLQLGRLQES